jgi:hypothetical protein
MKNKRCLLASLAVFVVIGVLEMVIHGKLLRGIYMQTASVWRPEGEMTRMMWMMWLGYLIMAPLFTYIFAKGVEEGRGMVGQGLRFGLLIGIFVGAPMSLGWYVVLPIPGILAFYWFLAGMVEMAAAGITVGLIYRK